MFVSGGELFMVNKSAPAKQAAAWKYLKFLDQPDSLTTWAIGTGYLPDPQVVGRQHARCSSTGPQNPEFKVAYDQLLERTEQRRDVRFGDRQLHRRPRRGA